MKKIHKQLAGGMIYHLKKLGVPAASLPTPAALAAWVAGNDDGEEVPELVKKYIARPIQTKGN